LAKIRRIMPSIETGRTHPSLITKNRENNDLPTSGRTDHSVKPQNEDNNALCKGGRTLWDRVLLPKIRVPSLALKSIEECFVVFHESLNMVGTPR
jgi:hypothetical protein